MHRQRVVFGWPIGVAPLLLGCVLMACSRDKPSQERAVGQNQELGAAGETPPKGAMGIACAKKDKLACVSKICVASGRTRETGYFCTTACADIDDCPDTWACVQTHPSAQSRVCVPPEGWTSRGAVARRPR